VQFAIDQYQLDWLDDQLQQSSTDVEIIFMHIPFPVMDISIKGIAKETYTEYKVRTHADDLIEIIKKDNASVRLIVAGHRDRNELTAFDFSEDFNFTQVLTAPFGHDPNNWRLIHLTHKDIIIYNTGAFTIQATLS